VSLKSCRRALDGVNNESKIIVEFIVNASIIQ
jgi:hypothetical protein